MVQALNLALQQEMEKDDSVIVLGEDVGLDGGVFRVTDGLIDQFGDQRVLDTPLAESAIAGMSIGMAAYGLKPVCEIQFSGFSYQNFHQIENHAARLRWRSRGRYHVPMVLRTPYGWAVSERWSITRKAVKPIGPIPRGLKWLFLPGPVMPGHCWSVPFVIRIPVIFYESKALYRAFREEVPDAEETLPIGQPQVIKEGKDLTLISYGAMMRPTLEASAELKNKDGIAAEVIDLLTISPLDEALLVQSAKKTGRVVVVHEAPRSFGPGAEVVSRLMEKAFYYLQAPIERVTGFDIVIPLFSREKAYLPSTERILRAARKVLATS